MVNHGKPLKTHHLCCVSGPKQIFLPLLRTQGTHGDDLFDLCDANLAGFDRDIFTRKKYIVFFWINVYMYMILHICNDT